MFKRETGDWTKYRGEGVMEINFHPEEGGVSLPYHVRMAQVYSDTLTALENAYERGVKRVLFTHGWSTSCRGKQTSRSEVRGVMRSKEATPYICRRDCIQHESVFVAVIRPAPAEPQN